MMIRTSSLWIASLLAVSGVTTWAQLQTGGFRGMPYQVTGRRVFARQVKGSPYSAQEITETMQTLADGSHIKNSVTNQIYRDVEGRVRMERTFGSGGAVQRKSVTIIDPVANVQYEMDPQAKTARKMTFQENPQAQPGGPAWKHRGATGPGAAAKPAMESLGHQSFEGVDAEGTRRTTTIPAGTFGNDAAIQIVNERWYSADLQATVMSRHTDPRSGETVFRLANISRANPDPSLFQVPADYQVKEINRPLSGRQVRPIQ